MQRQFFWSSLIEVGYVGHRGLQSARRLIDINQPAARDAPGQPGRQRQLSAPVYKASRRFRMEQSVANSMYNSLQVTWNRRFANGFGFGATYTLAKSMDSGSNYRDIVPDTYNASNMWGPSEFDSRHVVVFNYVYSLPFFKDKSTLSGKLLGGWQISGSNQFQTGTPCGVFGTTDVAQVGEVGSLGCGQTTGQFYNLNGTPAIVGQFAGGAGAASPNQYFAAANSSGAHAFHRARGRGRSKSAKGRARRDLPAMAFRTGIWACTRSSRSAKDLEFRARAFDREQPIRTGGNVASFSPTSPVFGKVTTKTNLSRNLQLSLRYAF